MSESGADLRSDTSGMLYTLFINVLLFVLLVVFFEANRNMKQVYLKRYKKKFKAILSHTILMQTNIDPIIYDTIRNLEESLLFQIDIFSVGLFQYSELVKRSVCT